MPDEVPSGDRAVFAFLELFALACAFEGVGALLRGEVSWRIALAFAGALLFFLIGIKWPELKERLPRLKTFDSRDPRLWLFAGVIAGIMLWVTGIRIFQRIVPAKIATRQPAIEASQAALPLPLPFVKGWGSGASQCTEMFDGSNVAANLGPARQNQYDIAVVCGIQDDTTDKFEDTRITVSGAFTIRPGDIPISVPYSTQMMEMQKHMLDVARKQTPGTKGIFVNQWYEPILLPKGIESSDVHRLSDVPKLGGFVISQGWPR